MSVQPVHSRRTWSRPMRRRLGLELARLGTGEPITNGGFVLCNVGCPRLTAV